jgi:hypothetical protein
MKGPAGRCATLALISVACALVFAGLGCGRRVGRLPQYVPSEPPPGTPPSTPYTGSDRTVMKTRDAEKASLLQQFAEAYEAHSSPSIRVVVGNLPAVSDAQRGAWRALAKLQVVEHRAATAAAEHGNDGSPGVSPRAEAREVEVTVSDRAEPLWEPLSGATLRRLDADIVNILLSAGVRLVTGEVQESEATSGAEDEHSGGLVGTSAERTDDASSSGVAGGILIIEIGYCASDEGIDVLGRVLDLDAQQILAVTVLTAKTSSVGIPGAQTRGRRTSAKYARQRLESTTEDVLCELLAGLMRHWSE